MKNSAALKYPDMRRELFAAVSALSGTRSSFAEFDFAVHIIFDDLSLIKNPGDAVGIVLIDEQESSQILAVAKAIETLLSRFGNNLSDEQYRAKREWSGIELESLKMWKMMVSNTPDLLGGIKERPTEQGDEPKCSK
jgi:hypothetical protein